MSGLACRLDGEALIADLSGALYWPAERTLIVADLHFEKGSSFARRGELLPPYDSRATLGTIQTVIRRYQTERVICLGDSFHDGDGPLRLPRADTDTLKSLAAAFEWIWIAGNHDPTPPAHLGGRVLHEHRIRALTFRHQATPGSAHGEISGHFHPRAAIDVRGRRVRGRCFVTDGTRLILPALGAYTGGLDVHDPAIASLMRDPFRVLLAGRSKLYDFPSTRVRRATIAAK